MVRLFVSDRIFNDGRISSGAIAVKNDGKVDEFLKNQTEIDKWLDANSHVEVGEKDKHQRKEKRCSNVLLILFSPLYRFSIITV